MISLTKNALVLMLVGVVAFAALACANQANLESKPNAQSKTAANEPNKAALANSAVQPDNANATQEPITPNAPAKTAGSLELSLPVDASTATAGSVVTVPVAITSKDKKEIFSYSFAIIYDPNVLKPAQPEIDTAGTLSQGSFQVVSDTQTKGRLGIAAASAGKTIPANGTLLKARFTVVGKTPGKLDLKVEKAVFEDPEGASLDVKVKTN